MNDQTPNPSNSNPSRRRFLGTAITAGAALTSVAQADAAPAVRIAAAKPVGANDRIRVAIIGCGGRGVGSHMADLEKSAKDYNLEIAGVCDVALPKLEAAAARVQENFGKKPKMTQRYAEILADPNIDAVTIATPDHAHSPVLADAARAGKHAFCEKPMADRLDSAKDALHACEEAGIVVQIGTQRRSDAKHRGSAKLIQTGILGTVTEVQTAWQRAVPSWERDYSDVKQEDVNWDQYLMHLPKRSFDPRRYRCWHLYKDYTSGLPGLLGSHIMDLATWFLEDPVPTSCVAHGAKLIWKNREHDDTCECVFEFPKGFLLTYSSRLGNSTWYGGEANFYGSAGTFNSTTCTAVPDGGVDAQKIKEAVTAKPIPCKGNGHMRNWLECIRSGEETTSPIRTGYNHSLLAIMAYRAMETGLRQRYDAQREDIFPM